MVGSILSLIGRNGPPYRASTQEEEFTIHLVINWTTLGWKAIAPCIWSPVNRSPSVILNRLCWGDWNCGVRGCIGGSRVGCTGGDRGMGLEAV